MENQQLQNKTNVSSSQSKRWRKMLFLVLCLGGIIVLIWFFAHRKSVGEIMPPQEVQTQTRDESITTSQYEGKYFTFRHEGGFERRFDQNDVKFPLLERQFLARTDVEGQKIAVAVQDKGTSSLEEHSAYRLRQLEHTVYEEEKYEKNGLSYTLFIKNSPVFEAGAFFEFDQKVASIVLSSPTQATGLREELLTLLDTLTLQETQ